jgi:hypothetical protein
MAHRNRGLPIKNGGSFHGYVTNNQMVDGICIYFSLQYWYRSIFILSHLSFAMLIKWLFDYLFVCACETQRPMLFIVFFTVKFLPHPIWSYCKLLSCWGVVTAPLKKKEALLGGVRCGWSWGRYFNDFIHINRLIILHSYIVISYIYICIPYIFVVDFDQFPAFSNFQFMVFRLSQTAQLTDLFLELVKVTNRSAHLYFQTGFSTCLPSNHLNKNLQPPTFHYYPLIKDYYVSVGLSIDCP